MRKASNFFFQKKKKRTLKQIASPTAIMGHKRSKQYDDETPASAANAEPRKRLKQYTDAHAKLADIFNRLADEVQTEREGATKELTALLSTNDTDQAQKILVRLARGLCSGRKAARFGFAVALTHILEQLYRQGKASAVAGEISVSQVIDLIRDNTQPPEGKISGQVSFVADLVTIKNTESEIRKRETIPLVVFLGIRQ